MKVVNAIISRDSKFLLIKRSSGIHSGKWAFPGGIIKENETSEQALKREIKEETNLTTTSIIRKISSYEYPRENSEKTLGECFLVTAEGKVKINHESSEFKWATLEEIEKLDTAPNLEEEALEAIKNL